MKKHNFNAGPSILPEVAIEETIAALKDFAGSGLSLASVSHRSKDFEAVMNETVALFNEVLNIPDGYKVVLLGGGASLQFCMIPYNLLAKKAVYVNTGIWAGKALKEAKLFGEVVEVKAPDFFSLPKNYSVPADADYVHITTNNTIYGTEIFEDPDFGGIPVIADASSDILSRPIDVSKYGMLYGGAQKNLGPSGLAFVIVREDILGKVDRKIPTMLDYKVHIENGSMFNTPPCIPIFTSMQTLKWIKSIGGLERMYEINKEKAALLYQEIDSNPLFRGTVATEDRSIMSVCWVMADKYKELEADFQAFAQSRGMVGIKGHRSVGGFRASLYNALPRESVVALVEAMKEFAAQKA